MGLNKLNFTARHVVDRLLPFVRKITGEPLPSVPGAGVDFYLEIEAIRCAGVTKICADLIERHRSHHGDAGVESLRRALDPIRLGLLSEFPACAAMLDQGTWPAIRMH